MLVDCLECEKQISDSADRCPYCGYPVSKTIKCNQFVKEFRKYSKNNKGLTKEFQRKNTTLYNTCKTTENGLSMTLTYYIITEPLCKEYSDMLRYGVRVDSQIVYEDGTVISDSRKYEDIFFRASDLYQFLDVIIDKRIKPNNLRDVLKKYIECKHNNSRRYGVKLWY